MERPAAISLEPQRGGLLTFLRNQTFRSLKHRNYRFYFAGQLVSFIGSWMQTTALMWLVFVNTQDPRWPALLMVAQFVPTLLLGPITGTIADRFPKRRIVLTTQALFVLTACLLTGLVALRQIDPWLIFGLLLVNGIIQAIDFPTRLAYVPELVPREDLINAVGLNSLLFNSARAIGPAGAGVLFWISRELAEQGAFAVEESTRYAALTCFVFNAISYTTVLLALKAIDVPGLPKRTSNSPEQPIWDGYSQIFRQRGLVALLVITGLLSTFGWPVLSLFPAYTRLGLGLDEKEYSTLVSGLGVGALLAALTTASFLRPGRRGFFLLLGSTFSLLGMLILALVGSITWAVLAAAGLGFGLILFLSTGQSTLQMSVDDRSRGRAMSLWAMMLSASAPMGHLLAGQAAKLFAIREVLLTLTVGLALVWLASILAVLKGQKARTSSSTPHIS